MGRSYIYIMTFAKGHHHQLQRVCLNFLGGVSDYLSSSDERSESCNSLRDDGVWKTMEIE